MGGSQNYQALDWVLGEIEQTLKQAQYALEAFADHPEDATHMRSCLTYLHQVHGTLKIVECFGASVLAEEMELLAQAFLSGTVLHAGEAVHVLMQAVVRLPVYLDRVKSKRRDIPGTVLPLINELRAARGEGFLPEETFFRHNLVLSKTVSTEEPLYQNLDNLPAILSKIRQLYQCALVAVFAGDDLDKNYAYLIKAATRMHDVSRGTPLAELWDVVTVLLELLSSGSCALDLSVKKVLIGTEKYLRSVVGARTLSVVPLPPESLLKDVLYHIAKSPVGVSERAEAVREKYDLARAWAEQQALNDADESIGLDRTVFQSLVTALKEEIAVIKDTLDLFVRGDQTDVDELKSVLPLFKQIGNTLLMLGLTEQQKIVQRQINVVADIVENRSVSDENLLIDVASDFVALESCLTEQLIGAAGDTSTGEVDPATEALRGARAAVLKESRRELEQAKEGIIQFIASSWSPLPLKPVPGLLRSARGSIAMIPLSCCDQILCQLIVFIEQELMRDVESSERQCDAAKMELLADALTSVEYYLERFDTKGDDDRSSLAVALTALERLGYPLISMENNEENIDASQNTCSEAASTQQSVADLDETTAAIEHNTGEQTEDALEEAVEDAEPEEDHVLDVEMAEEQFDIVEPQSVEPQSVEPQSVEPQSVEPQSVEPQSVEPQSVEPQAVEPQLVELQAIEPQAVELQSVELQEDAVASAALDPNPPVVSAPLSAESRDVFDLSAPLPALAPEEATIEKWIDDDVVDIFVEEAEEVLTTIQDAYPQWCRDTENHDALKEIRRAFHTLKGSGRMVGAQVVGEVSWAIENLLNRVIDRAITASPLVFALIEKTLECLPLLVDSFKQQQPTPVDVRGLTETAHLAAMGNRQINVKGMERLSEGSVREGAQEGEAEAASLANLAGLDPVLVEIFREEAAGHLAVVHEFLSESGGIDASPTNELLRALHTLKGCANMAGITAVSDVVTPLERFIKRIHRCNHFVDPALQNFLERCIQALNQALDGLMADPHRPVLPQEAFILELKSHIMRTLSERESEGIFEGVDCLSVSPFVTKIFLTKGVDKLLDAGHFLSSYRANPAELAPELNALYQQLALLRVSAQDAGIPEVVDLCRGLEYAYRSVESGATRVDDAFFATAHEAHDRLIDMMDNLANGLSIVSPEALSSRLLAFVPPEKIAEYNALPKPEILSSNRAHYVDNESEEVSIAPETSDKKISKNDALEVNVDPEVIDIFLDEAIDIMESAANLLRDWQQDNSNLLCVKELQRDLHTLKGGAHLADIRPVGELANRLEALYEGICDNRFEIKNELFELLNACHGSIGDMMTALRNGQTLPDPQVWLDAADAYLEQHSDHFDYEPVTWEERLTDEALEPETGALLPESSPEALPERPAAESMDEDGVSDAEPDAAAEASVSEASVSMDTDFSPSSSSSSSSSSVSGERVSPLQTLLGDDFDNLDIEVFSIFLEEAEELTEQADDALQAWLAEPKNSEHGHVLKRVVHTFKGGARLAGLSALGDLSHDFETFLEGMPIGVPDAAFLQETQRRFDQVVQWATNLRTVVQQHEDGEQVALSAAPEHVPESTTETAENDRVERDASLDEPPEPQFSLPVSPLPFSSLPSSSEDSSIVAHVRNESGDDVRRDEHESNAASASVEAKTPDPVPLVRTAAGLPLHHAVTVPHKVEMPSVRRELKAGRRGGESVKVLSSLLEKLVNLAGESSIFHGRVENEVNRFHQTIDDMGATIDRLRDLLRRLDIETEAHVLHRYERDKRDEGYGQYEDFDPLEMDRYSALNQLSRSLSESASDLVDLKDTLGAKVRNAETLLIQQSRVNTELQEGLMRTQLEPFSKMIPRLRRIVRQVSAELGKQVELEVINAEGELDRNVLDRMVAPLEHMLRNAVDHGIETPEERKRTDKNPMGRITLFLSREGGEVVLRLSDDGKGISVDSVKRKAIAQGLMTEETVLSDVEIMQFIFRPGFSTASQVTQISGRGVGMDVVNSEIKQLGGSLKIHSAMGVGTQFTVRLPFTVSVNRALMVVVGEDHYAIPLSNIEGIVRVSPYELINYYKPNAPQFGYAGRQYRLEYLGRYVHGNAVPPLDGIANPLPVLLLRSSENAVALQVDQLVGSREVVVKSLGPQLSTVSGISGATILGDGNVVIILDLLAMLRARRAEVVTGKETTGDGAFPVSVRAAGKRRKTPLIMVVDDSVTVRKVTSRLLERHGLEVVLAKDGVDAITKLQDIEPDVMLLDIEMPRMDGFEVASQVRHSERLRELPIIMITSRTGEKHRNRAFSLGVNKYMGKPFQETQLLENIRELLKQEVDM